MMKWSHLALPSLALLALTVAFTGCSPTPTGNPASAPNMTFPGPGSNGTPIQQIMKKYEKGQDPVWTKINNELNMDSPPWDDLQPRTKEFADLAGNVAKNPAPPKNPETWDKDAKDFAVLAADLNTAVQAKNTDAARMIQIRVKPACDACHAAHRGRPS